MLSAPRLISLAVGAVLASTSLASTALASAGPTAGTPSPRPWVVGDHTVPHFKLDEAVKEVVDVTTEYDRDRDGTKDTVKVEITRPAAAAGARVPLILHASPYFAVGGRLTWETDYFVPRGYAVATVALPGTELSTGCNDVGGPLEVLGTKAVIDWANGRAVGHYPNGSLADATTWTDGKTAMIGVSWDGTIANAVAATGVEGLETIVPVAAISSWYDYTRHHGVTLYKEQVKFLADYVSSYNSDFCRALTPKLQASSGDATGNYNSWWAKRDYRLNASKIKASVFLVHGLTDENVTTRQFGEWWEELSKHKVERRLFLHQLPHIDPAEAFGSRYTQPLQQWFDYYLQGLDNGVLSEPQAIIQREDYTWSTDAVWPPAGITQQKLKLSYPVKQPGGQHVGTLTAPQAQIGESLRGLTFGGLSPATPDKVVMNPTLAKNDRAVFLSSPLSSPVRMSGTATISLRVKVKGLNKLTSKLAAAFQVRVVDYSLGTAYIVSRTKADLSHYESIKVQRDLTEKTWYTLTWEINTDDRIFDTGHAIGLVLTNERANPLVSFDEIWSTIDLEKSWISMPLSGDLGTMSRHGVPNLSGFSATTITSPEPTTDPREFVREFFEGSRPQR